jgi:hypothetical protein
VQIAELVARREWLEPASRRTRRGADTAAGRDA